MEQSNSLLLNEDAFRQCPEAKKPVFIYEWLRYLDRILPTTQKGKLLEQLLARIASGPGPPTRTLLAKCIASVYRVGDPYDLFATINVCNDTIRAKDDSPSQLPIKLTALACLAALYSSLGRMVGRSFEESFQLMVKWLRNAESRGRLELMTTFTAMVTGLGVGGSTIHKDLYKLVRPCLADRVMSVRVAAIHCLIALVPELPSMYTLELESVVGIALKTLESSNYDVRCAIARLLAVLLAHAHDPPAGRGKPSVNPSGSSTTSKTTSLDECLALLSSGFLRGGIGGFLKSGSGAQAGIAREIRIGVTLAYIEFVKELGAVWLERNLAIVVKHLLDMISKCGTLAYTNNTTQYAEVVYMRRCVGHVLRRTVGLLLSEPAQILVCKQLGLELASYINSFDYSLDPGVERVLGVEAHASAQATSVALLELSALVRQIGTAITPLFIEASGIMEPVFACLLHPIVATRIAAAWCLRCVTYAVPSQLTPLIDRCVSRLEHMKSCADAISGYSLALAALIAGSVDCKLGIPHGKSRQVMQVAEEMVKTASMQSRLTQVKTSSGWLLIAAVVNLGPAAIGDHLPRLALLWKAAFPRSVKETESEKTRGDAFTWTVILEARIGVLTVMERFLAQCKSLHSDDVTRKILHAVECSLTMLAQTATVIRGYGSRVRALLALTRTRVYTLLSHLPARYYEHLFAGLLRELVADLTLSDNVQSSQTTSLLPSLCDVGVDACLLGSWLHDTDDRVIEFEMQTSQQGTCGAIENDPLCMLTACMTTIDTWPEPLPVNQAVLDAAIMIYGRVFPLVPAKHKLQMIEHFGECVKAAKPTGRQQAIQVNLLAAQIVAFRSLSEMKSMKLDGENLQQVALQFIVAGLGHASPLVRCASAEALGRLAQAVGDAQFVAGTAQFTFDKLRSCRDANNRTGYALALGCLHRYVGSLGSGQHLNTAVSIILALAQDNTCTMVQSWSIVALSQIAETGGGMFRGYVEPSLSLCLRLLLSTAFNNVDVVQCIGKLISSLITVVGPELSASIGSIESTRSSFLIACALLFSHNDAMVKAEAIAGLQQLHLFAPRFVQLDELVVQLCRLLTCSHLILRKSALCCLRQLLQREAREVRDHAMSLVPQGMCDMKDERCLPETGLEGALFAMLDVESDAGMRTHIKESIVSLVQATIGDSLTSWLALVKEILAASGPGDSRSLVNEDKIAIKADDGEKDEDDGGDDDDTLQVTTSGTNAIDRGKLSPRWATRVFAAEIVQRLMVVCDSERAHLDLALAKELQLASNGRADYLVLHVADLVRMSFMAATSDNTRLRLAGLSCLQAVITRFAIVPEPEFPGHVILEQFQAQVGAALRPAFADETESHVTAAACEVCSTWICSRVARDLNDLRRVHQLLVSSLGKLKQGSISTQLYSESASTLEKLAILKAWAEVYAVAVKEADGEREEQEDGLLALVTPELAGLVAHWLAALRDSALLSLPGEFASQLPPDGGAYYTSESIETCRDYYRTSWPAMILATATWLSSRDFDLPGKCSTTSKWPDERKETRWDLMFGICIETLCSSRSYSEGDHTVQLCLRTLARLIACEWAQGHLMRDVTRAIELLNVMHRLILTRDCVHTQRLCMRVVEMVLNAAALAIARYGNHDRVNGNVQGENGDMGYCGGEGGIVPSRSIAFATLEVCLCVLVRQIPQMNTHARGTLHYRKYTRLPIESNDLIRVALHTLIHVPGLCEDAGRIIVLPTILYLIVGVIRETAKIDLEQMVPDAPPGHVSRAAAAAMQVIVGILVFILIQALRALAQQAPKGPTLAQWVAIMQSTMLTLANLAYGDSRRIDVGVVMLACAVIATVAPRAVVVGKEMLVRKMVGVFKMCIESKHTQVQVKCLQSLVSIFSRRDIAAPFIRSLSPSIFALIRPFVIAEPTEDEMLRRQNEISEEQLNVIQEACKCLETIETTADAQKKALFVNLLVQSLGELLCRDVIGEYRQLPVHRRRAHDFALQRLNVIGPANREQFLRVLNAFPRIRQRLEAAMAFANRGVASAAAKALSGETQVGGGTPQIAQPSIKLKMDFSAFAAS